MPDLHPSAPVTVRITDVIPHAVTVPAVDLQPGDQVFDVHGRPHPIRHVRRLARGRMRTARADGVVDVWPAGQDVTVLRAGAVVIV